MLVVVGDVVTVDVDEVGELVPDEVVLELAELVAEVPDESVELFSE